MLPQCKDNHSLSFLRQADGYSSARAEKGTEKQEIDLFPLTLENQSIFRRMKKVLCLLLMLPFAAAYGQLPDTQMLNMEKQVISQEFRVGFGRSSENRDNEQASF